MKAQHPPTLDQLQQFRGKVVAWATNLKNWHESKRRFWRFMSHVSLGAAFLGIVVGTILPLVSLDAQNVLGMPFESTVRFSMAFLIVAGLAYTLNQAFTISLNWERHRDAQTKIETLLQESEDGWIRMKASIPDDDTPNEKRDEALALCHNLVMGVTRVDEEGTDVWATEIAAGRSALEKLLTKWTECG